MPVKFQRNGHVCPGFLFFSSSCKIMFCGDTRFWKNSDDIYILCRWIVALGHPVDHCKICSFIRPWLSVSDYECKFASRTASIVRYRRVTYHRPSRAGIGSAAVTHTNTPRQVGLARKHCSFIQYDFGEKYSGFWSDKIHIFETFLPEIKPMYSTEKKTMEARTRNIILLTGWITRHCNQLRHWFTVCLIINLHPCRRHFLSRVLYRRHRTPSLWSILAVSCINGQESNLILFAEGGHLKPPLRAVKFMGRHTGINFELCRV